MAYDLHVEWDLSTAGTGVADGRESLFVDGVVTGDVYSSRCYVAGKSDGVHDFVFLPKMVSEGDVVSVNGEEVGKAHITSAPGPEWSKADGVLVRQASVEVSDGAPWLTSLWQHVLPGDSANG